MNLHWSWLNISHMRSTGLLHVIAGPRWLQLSLLNNIPVDEPMQMTPTFVRDSAYTLRFIVHPNGGNAMQIVCDSCGASYPFNWQMQKFVPCAMCAVRRQSGVRVSIGGWIWQSVKEV